MTLLTRDGCHLCDQVRQTVSEVAADTGADWSEVDVDADPETRAEYGDRVPVVLVDGVEHGHFRVDRQQLLAALR